MRRPYLASVVLGCLLAGCAEAPRRNFGSLRDKGILPLSVSNPFVGSNLFLAREAEKSSYLFNFLEARGGPRALMIEEERRMVLFYPKEKESYVGELELSGRGYEWVIRGPYAIDRQEYRALSRLESGPRDHPVFQISGRSYRFGTARHEERPGRILAPSITILPRPKPPPKPVAKKRSKTPVFVAKGAPVAEASPTPFRPMNLDQQAIAMSQGLAERSPTGDVVHTAVTEGETLIALAEWYTGQGTNDGTIAEANGIEKGAPLPKGARVIIPLKLVKNFKAKR